MTVRGEGRSVHLILNYDFVLLPPIKLNLS